MPNRSRSNHAGWQTLASCADISEQDAERAASSVAELHAFLVRVAQIARADDGGPRLLGAIARLAAQPWLDAELEIELVGDDSRTTVSIFYEGGALRERLIPQIDIAVPVDEFVCAALASPRFAAPLQIVVADDRLVLRMPSRAEEVPPTVRLPREAKTAPPPTNSHASRRSGLHSLTKGADSLIVPGPDPRAAPEVYTKTTVPRMAVVDAKLLVPRRDPRREDD